MIQNENMTLFYNKIVFVIHAVLRTMTLKLLRKTMTYKITAKFIFHLSKVFKTSPFQNVKIENAKETVAATQYSCICHLTLLANVRAFQKSSVTSSAVESVILCIKAPTYLLHTQTFQNEDKHIFNAVCRFPGSSCFGSSTITVS
jgi:hypothetical protein